MFDGDSVPASPAVWARAVLFAPEREEVAAAVAVATDRVALEESLERFSAGAARIVDYDEVAYHFFDHRG